jgi:hypothetical protein
VFSRNSLLLATHPALLAFDHPVFSYTYELLLPPDRFTGPLFSNTYELLFPQILSFDNHLRCPMFFASALSSNSLSRLRNFLTSFPATHTKSPARKSFSCYTYENIGGWGPIKVNAALQLSATCLRSAQNIEPSNSFVHILLRTLWSLFALFSTPLPFVFNTFQTLLRKHPGVGVPPCSETCSPQHRILIFTIYTQCFRLGLHN